MFGVDCMPRFDDFLTAALVLATVLAVFFFVVFDFEISAKFSLFSLDTGLQLEFVIRVAEGSTGIYAKLTYGVEIA